MTRIRVSDWDDEAAFEILADLDVADDLEMTLFRGDGEAALPLVLFADWRAANAGRALSVVAWTGPVGQPRPFALLGVMPTGAAGVFQAALLARDHRRFRSGIVQLVRMMRERLPDVAERQGIRRLECRSWADHPRAGRLLRALGFEREARLAGFGGGSLTFDQWAWIRKES